MVSIRSAASAVAASFSVYLASRATWDAIAPIARPTSSRAVCAGSTLM